MLTSSLMFMVVTLVIEQKKYGLSNTGKTHGKTVQFETFGLLLFILFFQD